MRYSAFMSMNILVNGLGNIGTTLANVLLQYRQALNIDHVYVYKNLPQPWHEADLSLLQAAGATVLVADAGPLVGLNVPAMSYEEALTLTDYVFETREHGFANREKSLYQTLINDTNHRLKAVCAQGSEKGFGVPYMAGLDPQRILRNPFVHIVSCNTHGIASVLQTLCGDDLSELDHADAVVVRRSEDLGSNGRLVGGNVVARHLDDQLGTHHAIDVTDMFRTLGINVDITSSDITTPSQVMHGMRFNIHCKHAVDAERLRQRLYDNPYIATTTKFDSAEIAALGRRYGTQGRIYAQSIVVENQLLIKKNTVRGWAFIPQEACTILSSIEACLYQLGQYQEAAFVDMRNALIQQRW